jgi:hypothetical protein
LWVHSWVFGLVGSFRLAPKNPAVHESWIKTLSISTDCIESYSTPTSPLLKP